MKKRLLAAVITLVLTAALSPFAMAANVVGVLDDAPKPLDTEERWLEQCELGSTATDAMREAADTQLALLETSVLVGDLSQGEVTEEMLQKVFAEDREIVTASVTPALLCQMLEQSVNQIEVNPETEQVREETMAFDGFCQISGFTFCYDASAPSGQRIQSITLDDGTELTLDDKSSIFTLAITRELAEGAYGFPAMEYTSTGKTLCDALRDTVALHVELPEGESDRIRVIGARQNELVGQFPRPLLAVGIGVLTALLAVFGLRHKRWKEEQPETDIY